MRMPSVIGVGFFDLEKPDSTRDGSFEKLAGTKFFKTVVEMFELKH
jgi:hypothetical protein